MWGSQHLSETSVNDLDHIKAIQELGRKLSEWEEKKDKKTLHELDHDLKCMQKTLFMHNRSSVDGSFILFPEAEEVVSEFKELYGKVQELTVRQGLNLKRFEPRTEENPIKAQNALQGLQNKIHELRVTTQFKLRAILRAAENPSTVEFGSTAMEEEEELLLCSAFKVSKRKVQGFSQILILQNTLHNMQQPNPDQDVSEEQVQEQEQRWETAMKHATKMVIEMQHAVATIRAELYEILGQPEEFFDDEDTASEDGQAQYVDWLQNSGTASQMQDEISQIQTALLWERKGRQRSSTITPTKNTKEKQKSKKVTIPQPYSNETYLQFNYRVIEKRLYSLGTELHLPCLDLMLCKKYFLDDQNESNLLKLADYVEILSDIREYVLVILKNISVREDALYELKRYTEAKGNKDSDNLETQTTVVMHLFKLQQATLAVVEGIQAWRKLLTRPFSFEWNGMNYLLKIHIDCKMLDCGWLQTSLPLKLTQYPLCSNLQSLLLIGLGSVGEPNNKPSKNADLMKRLKAAEKVVKEEAEVQKSLVQELTELYDAHKFLPIVGCMNIIPNCYIGVKLSQDVYNTWGPKIKTTIEHMEESLLAMKEYGDRILKSSGDNGEEERRTGEPREQTEGTPVVQKNGEHRLEQK